MDQIEKIYMTKSLANRLYMYIKKKFLLKMIEGSSLDEHIEEFNKVYNMKYEKFYCISDILCHQLMWNH